MYRDLSSIIPLPLQVEKKADEFVITPETVISADAHNRWNAIYLRDLIAPPTGLPLPIQSGDPAPQNAIRLTTAGDPVTLGREGYKLTVSRNGVNIEAPEARGVFYAIQTLRQLLPVEIEKQAFVPNVVWRVPGLAITDAPRFQWRGYMMDEGRHFHGKDTMLRTLDLMALQKLNVLHWHLTEDQGWRIEIRAYPRLTEVGSVRQGTTRGFLGRHNGTIHGGFYTQEEIQEIVAYAAQRHITIVPEIEMPGHSTAALAAYPELSCTGGPFEVACRFGLMWDIFCAGKDQVFTFLQRVLDEVMALFPSPFIHIGGDEVFKRRWKKCPDCQSRIKQEGLKDEQALQIYFINRIGVYLASQGRRMVGWNDILSDDLSDDAVIQYWIRHRKQLIEHIRRGRDVIVSSYWHLYLDHSHNLTPLSRAYRFELLFPQLDARDERHILGLEAPMWTEFVPTRARLDYQTYPRLTAYAETGWSPREKRNFDDFKRRLVVFLARLDQLGVKYAPMNEAQPSWLKQLFGVFTIVQAQTKTAP